MNAAWIIGAAAGAALGWLHLTLFARGMGSMLDRGAGRPPAAMAILATQRLLLTGACAWALIQVAAVPAEALATGLVLGFFGWRAMALAGKVRP